MEPQVTNASETSALFDTSAALICWLSFEARSIAVLKHSEMKSDVFAFRYKEFEYENKTIIREARKRAGKKIRKEIELDRADQFGTLSSLRKILTEICSSYPRVVIDISCFPREALLMLTYALWRLSEKSQVQFLYNIAKEYSYEEAGASKWLGRGIKKISPVLGFGGRILPGRHFTLIGLVGMDEERYVRLVEAIDPNHLVTGIAKSQLANHTWLTTNSLAIVQNLKAKIPVSESFEFNCNSLSDTYQAITGVFNRVSDQNVIIISLNSKISTLASGVFALANRTVQICSAPALVYNYSSYSVPGDDFYFFDLAYLFGPLEQH